MSLEDEQNEIVALLTRETSRAMEYANKAIANETSDRYQQAIVEYGYAVKILYNMYCFLSGVIFQKIKTKTSTTVNFDRAYLSETVFNKITDIYKRINVLDNLLSSGNAETYSLMRSVDIPLDISSKNDVDSLNDVVKEVLVQVEIDPEIDTFENIIGHSFTKDKLKELSHTFVLNVNENTKNILQSRHVSSNMMIILYGEPGTGKTSLVKALAHHLNVKLYELKLSALYNKYVGESEKTMSSIFDWVLSSSEPKIVFIDELDSLFSKRGAGNEESLDRKLKTIFMTEINRFQSDQRTNTLIIGATNLIEDIDEAIARRSVLNVYVGKPKNEEEYVQLVLREFSKLKLNVERRLYSSIVRTAVEKKLSQSKVIDIVKKLFSFVTARLSNEIYVRKFRDSENYYSLNGNILGAEDEKYIIVTASAEVKKNLDGYDIEKVRLDCESGAELASSIVLPFITEELWNENQKALI